MGYTDFKAFGMSASEQAVRQQNKVDRDIKGLEKESWLNAQAAKNVKEVNDGYKQRLHILDSIKKAGIELNDAQTQEYNRVKEQIALHTDKLENFKKEKTLIKAYNEEQIKSLEKQRKLEDEIKKLRADRSEALKLGDKNKSGELGDQLKNAVGKLREERNTHSGNFDKDFEKFISSFGSKENRPNRKSEDTVNHIYGVLTGKEVHPKGVSSGFTQVGDKLESFKNPLLKGGGKLLQIVGSISDCCLASVDALDALVDNAAKTLAGFYGITNAYLEGSDKTAKALMDASNDMFGGSMLVKQTDYLNNIKSMAAQGIAFNIEQRALLETIKDKTLPTFDSMDSALTRLVRLKKSDLSQPFFGMEEALKKSLNSMFQDSSYLQNLYDAVNGILVNSSSKQSASNITAYNSTVQSWLGAMYESGVSDSVINNIASAIDALGSGNINALQGNTTAQNLLLLSMDSIGMDYADILQNGLTAGTTNDLMKAMVNYLAKIAGNTEDNNVLRSAYGNIFNLTMADTEAIQNLAGKTGSIGKNATTTTASALSAFANSAANIDQNYLMSEKIDTFIDNFKFDMGYDIASSDTRYGMWKLSKFALNTLNSLESVFSSGGGSGSIVDAFSPVKNAQAVIGSAIGAAKLVPEALLMGNAGYSILQTLGDILGENATAGDFFKGGNNTVLNSIELGIDKNMYGDFAGQKRSSSYYARSGANYRGSTYYDDTSALGYLKTLANKSTTHVSSSGSIFGGGGGKFGVSTDINTLSTPQDYSSYWKDDVKAEEDPVLSILKKCEVESIEGEGHHAIAVYVTGMSDPTLLSFASIFTDKDEDLVKALQDVMEGKNTTVGDQKTILTYAQQSTSTTEKTSSNTGEKSKSSNATKDK